MQKPNWEKGFVYGCEKPYSVLPALGNRVLKYSLMFIPPSAAAPKKSARFDERPPESSRAPLRQAGGEGGDSEFEDLSPVDEHISLKLEFEVSPDKNKTNRLTVDKQLRLRIDTNGRSKFTWIINGKPRPNLRAQTLSSDDFDKGDEISARVEVTKGHRRKTETIKKKVVNMAPEWRRGCQGISGNPSGYTVKAVDPDSNAAVRYSLKGEPKGLTIGQTSGMLSYQGVDARPGSYRVSIIATDAEGDTADHCAFSMKISVDAAK